MRLMLCICPQCGSNAAFYLQATDVNHKTDGATFNYYRCFRCKLVFLYPIPANISSYYTSDYHQIPTSLEQLAQLENKLHWRVELVQKYKDKGSLLEIGSSYGAFAYGAEQAGFRVEAIEMDKNCCDFINATNKVTAINTTDIVQTMIARNTTYDVIALWHSIEHIADPWAVLKQCEKSLRPGGVLIISTPNPDSIQFRLFKQYWMHLDAPRHVELIPLATLTDFFRKIDMPLLYTTTTDPDGLSLSKWGWYNSARYLFGTSGEENILRKTISKALLTFVSPVERWMQHGAAYTAVYQKTN